MIGEIGETHSVLTTIPTVSVDFNLTSIPLNVTGQSLQPENEVINHIIRSSAQNAAEALQGQVNNIDESSGVNADANNVASNVATAGQTLPGNGTYPQVAPSDCGMIDDEETDFGAILRGALGSTFSSQQRPLYN